MADRGGRPFTSSFFTSFDRKSNESNKKGDVGSQTTCKYRFKEDTSAEFAALFTADVVTPKNRATSAPGYPIFLTAS